MQDVSVQNGRVKHDRPSTRAIVCDEALADQCAAVLMADRNMIRQAFVGEPVREVIALVEWAMKHEDDEGFDAGLALRSWAKRRGRGAWREDAGDASRVIWGEKEPSVDLNDLDGSGDTDHLVRLAQQLAWMWVEHPNSLAHAIQALERDRSSNGNGHQRRRFAECGECGGRFRSSSMVGEYCRGCAE